MLRAKRSNTVMSFSGDPQRLARVEWVTARILLALGMIVIVGGFFAPISFHSTGSHGGQSIATQAVPTPAESPGQTFCNTATAVAANYGTLPGGARAAGVASKTDVQGRYTCEASSGNASFTITVELECANIHDQTCFSLYAVKSADGTALYQRQ